MSPRVHNGGDELKHPFHPLPIFDGEIIGVRASGERGDQEKIEHELLIRNRLFAVDAVRGILQQRFADQLLLRVLRPSAGLAPVWPGMRGDKQSGQFPD